MFDGMVGFSKDRWMIRSEGGTYFEAFYTGDDGAEGVQVGGSWRNGKTFATAEEAVAGCDYLAYEGHGHWTVWDRTLDENDPLYAGRLSSR